MFQESRPVFIYCLSPVHMGSGTAVGGLIDNPIQRERHTEFPMFSSSGLKGAVRHHVTPSLGSKIVNRLFGPESTGDTGYAGALSFTDAQLLLFPVRSPKRAFVYATCPTALARAKRLLSEAQMETPWEVPEVQENNCLLANEKLLSGDKLALEVFEFQRSAGDATTSIASWISEKALPVSTAYSYFREKIKSDLVVLSDTDFTYFVKNATVVEPHVRINNATGTAEEGGLFYTENLPPESLLLSLLMTSRERGNNGDGDGTRRSLSAEEIMKGIANGEGLGEESSFPGLHGHVLQVGGDATTGRGQVALTILGKK